MLEYERAKIQFATQQIEARQQAQATTTTTQSETQTEQTQKQQDMEKEKEQQKEKEPDGFMLTPPKHESDHATLLHSDAFDFTPGTGSRIRTSSSPDTNIDTKPGLQLFDDTHIPPSPHVTVHSLVSTPVPMSPSSRLSLSASPTLVSSTFHSLLHSLSRRQMLLYAAKISIPPLIFTQIFIKTAYQDKQYQYQCSQYSNAQ